VDVTKGHDDPNAAAKIARFNERLAALHPNGSTREQRMELAREIEAEFTLGRQPTRR
jgi:hypothetical protein